MRWLFSRFAKPARRRGARRREVFAAQFDGGKSTAAACTSIHLGCDVLERRIVLTASPQGDSVFSQGTITSIVVPDSVKLIDDKAFQNNSKLATVSFGNNAVLTSVRFVGNAPNVGTDAFAGAAAIRAASRAEAPRFLSAFWGLDDGMPQQLDGMPITFSWLINPASIDPADFNVIRSDGTVIVPAFATLRPANESNETQTILLTGDFGDAETGVRPVRVRLVGQLVGSPPGSKRSEVFSDLVSPPIRRLSAGPSIVDAWRIDPALLTNDANACTVGSAFVRVVWSGGITDFPTGNEVGVAVTRAYRLTYLHRGKTVTVAPLEIGDLNDGDNMHDLSFPAIPARAKLLTITLPGRHVEDPNGDSNSFQMFRFKEPNLYLRGWWRPSFWTITLPGRHVEDPNGDPNSFQVFRFREPNLYPTGWRPWRR